MSFKEKFTDYVNNLFRHDSDFDEAIKYALLPPGKLFRPHLFLNLCKDLDVNNVTTFYFATFLEFHHAYTLVHDDLPSMDDSSERRSKPSLHVQYNEAMAVLVGDALLNQSYAQLNECNLDRKKDLTTFCTWALGFEGLILGQVEDLFGDDKVLNSILNIHELKTSRLIQCATMGAYYFSGHDDEKIQQDFYKLGLSLGLNFQIKDDKDDFKSKENDEVNIFNDFSEQAQDLLEKTETEIHLISEKYNLKNFRKM